MIDIKEINSIKYNIGIRFNEGTRAGIRAKRNIYTGIFNYFYSLISSFFKYPLSFKCIGNCEGGSLILYSSENQEVALMPVHTLLQSHENHKIASFTKLPMWYAYCYSLLYVSDFIKFYKQSNNIEKGIIGNEFNAFFRSYGDYKMFERLFRLLKPKIIIVANDHTPFLRTAMLVAKNYSIKSLYVQHAAVTDKFPKMIADYAFLDGIDSFEKYKSKGILSEKVFIIGGSRFDYAINRIRPNYNKQKKIGVALTLKDVDKSWKGVITVLREMIKSDNIVLRPHPSMPLNEIRDYCDKEGISFSNPSAENSFTFLSNIDFLVANETSIHLDAAIMHVPSVICSGMSDRPFTDHYGFVKAYVVEQIDSAEELSSYIRNYHYNPSDEYIRYYNASYKTSIEGHVSEIIANYVCSQLKGESFTDSRLKEIDHIVTII